MEPTSWADPDGARQPRGVGLVQGTFFVLPRSVDLRLVQASSATSKPRPGNHALPADWRMGGIDLGTCDRLELQSVRMISWDREGDDSGTTWGVWTRSDITKLVVEQQSPALATDPPHLDRMWLWQYQEPNPKHVLDPNGGIAWEIDRSPGLRVDLDLDSYQKGTLAAWPRHWRWLAEPWWPKAELQMGAYAGVEAMDSRDGLSNPTDGPGPTDGQWFIRSFDQILGSSVYFSNTGGTPFSRPRIWA